MNTKTAVEMDRLIEPEDVQGQIESYKIIADAAMHVIYKENKVFQDVSERYAHNLYQMTALKCLSVMRLMEKKLNYLNGISHFGFEVYDSFGLQPIVRAQFEAFGHFNNVYINSGSQEEKKLKFDLWALCGLLNRQKFPTSTSETAAKKAKEAQEIADLETEIKSNPCYLALEPKYQQLIFDKAKQSDWKLAISGNKAIFIGWQQLAKNAGTNTSMDNLYRSFSLGAHPSYVSVFQFRDAYEKGNEGADFFMVMALKLSKFFMSFYIADYCKYSPEAKLAFDQMPALHQLLVNAYNRNFRGASYAINDINLRFEPILAQAITQGLIKVKGINA